MFRIILNKHIVVFQTCVYLSKHLSREIIFKPISSLCVPKIHTRIISNIHKDFDLYQVIILSFQGQTGPKFRTSNSAYYLHTAKTIYYMTKWILCHYLPSITYPNLFIYLFINLIIYLTYLILLSLTEFYDRIWTKQGTTISTTA